MNISGNPSRKSVAYRTGKKKRKFFFFSETASPDFRSLALLLLVVFALTVIFLKWFFEDRVDGFLPGEPSARTYFALYPMKYVDEEGTYVLRSRVGDTIAGVLVRDGAGMDRLISRIEMMAEGDVVRLSLSPQLTDLIKSHPEEKRKRILQESARLADIYLQSQEGEAPAFTWSPEVLWREIEKLALPMEENNIIYQVLDEVLQPLARVDPDLTRALREDMAASLQAVERSVGPGDVLVEKGQVITDQAARILEMQGYSKVLFPWKQILFALILLPFWPLWLSIQAGGRDSGPDTEETFPWIYLAFIVGMSWVSEYASSLFQAQGMGALFLAGCAYLTLPSRLALQLVLGGGILAGLVATGFSTLQVLLVSFMGIVSAFGGFFLLRDVHSRGHFWKQLFLLGVIQTITGFIIRWAFSLPFSGSLLLSLVLAAALWSSLVIAVLPLLEDSFDVLSPLRLIELSHPSNPLLKKLQIEAAGTYHHSLMLGTLAETVADKLGMNANLLKAGAYFHDIGKLRRPVFFVENQMGGENVHDELKPSLSALVILSHVREGLELAEEYHLPRIIRSFIAEHHGTTCLSYFYRKAKTMGLSIPRDQFCYPGPRPRSRETGLLMLVDSVEAALRAEVRGTLSTPDIKDTIARVVDSKIAEGQLDNIDFTLRDLAVIRETLLSALQTMYHTRKVQEIKEKETLQKNNAKQEDDVQ
jgi:hypothetical protein